MILRGDRKPERLLEMIERTVCASARPRVWLPDDVTPESSLLHPGENLFYLGGGYWRAAPMWNTHGLVGVRLVNPDRTFIEIQIVEQAVAILHHLQWSGGGDIFP